MMGIYLRRAVLNKLQLRGDGDGISSSCRFFFTFFHDPPPPPPPPLPSRPLVGIPRRLTRRITRLRDVFRHFLSPTWPRSVERERERESQSPPSRGL